MNRFRPATLFGLLAVICYAFTAKAQSNPCLSNADFHIVVLGSSTAAGAGASSPDSAWVNRYRVHLQSINPANQVTNRAQGGFTTYQLMPSGFTPPSGRPAPNLSRNISYAIGLAPDAIIVNLPSNDVSSGYSVAEQLSNFDSIVGHANAAGIPIWVCTTQPKNYGGNLIPIQKQLDVRDSIWVRYSPRVLDFWTGLADSSNQLAAYYDSGDGTHLNDIGHGELAQRAANADLPSDLFVGPASIDEVAAPGTALWAPICGDSFSVFRFPYFNIGPDDTSPVPIQLAVENLSNGQQWTFHDTITNGLLQCEADTVDFTVNTWTAGIYEMRSIVSSPNDGNALNDTILYQFESSGHPDIQVVSDTGCSPAILTLEAMAGTDDSLRWFDINGNFLAWGTSFQTPLLSSSASYFVEAVRGDLFYRNSIFTSNNSSIDWNGAMFDLVADSILWVDALEIKVNSTGNQVLEIYTRSGSHLGHEMNAASWTQLGSFPVLVTDPLVPVRVEVSALPMGIGDTLGVYVQLQNAGSDLSYLWMSAPLIRSNGEIQILTGSGSSHNFGGNFYPRDLNVQVDYHFGSRLDGDCVSPRAEVLAVVGSPSIGLGNDTILDVSSSLLLDAGAGFSGYAWSTGDTGQSILLDGNVLGTGIYTVVVEVLDVAGCMASDTVIVVFAPLVSRAGEALAEARAYPNPSNGKFHVDLESGNWKLKIRSLDGQLVWEGQRESINNQAFEFDLIIASGLYFLEMKSGTNFHILPLMISPK